MKQVFITAHGGPEKLQIREAPDPVPNAGEVRIRVRAAGINFADIMARKGLYPDAPKPPCVVGYEVSGVVDACGAGVPGEWQGKQVVALTRFNGYAELAACDARDGLVDGIIELLLKEMGKETFVLATGGLATPWGSRT